MKTHQAENFPVNPWLVRAAGGRPTMRLYCFSHAGGSATDYLPWRALFDTSFEICAIQLPGRGARMRDQPCIRLPMLVEDLAHVIAADAGVPFAFFGHSLGGLLAFETARYCQQHRLPMPAHLFASGCAAPQDRSPARQISGMPDNELVELLRSYNGTPPEVLANAELMDMVLPVIRADFALVEKYAYVPAPALAIPITVLAGSNDEGVTRGEAEGWAKETTAECRIQYFEGGHFFLNRHLPAIATCILSDLGMLSLA